MEYHVLKKIQLGFIDVGWLLQKMLNPYPKCTLFALFWFNCCGIFWKVPNPSES
jgi:hypothetical protein